MKQPDASAKWILLAGGGDEDLENWRIRFDQLERRISSFPNLAPFIGVNLQQQSTLDSALALLERCDGNMPILAIINADLNSINNDPNLDSPAVQLMRHLHQQAKIPVLVNTEDPAESALRCVLECAERQLWSNKTPRGETIDRALAVALNNLVESNKHRRLIIRVAPNSITYRIMFGAYTYTPREKPYVTPLTVNQLFQDAENYTPITRETNWLKDVSELARASFNHMISEPLGPAMVSLIERIYHWDTSPPDDAPLLDLRFEFNLDEYGGARYFSLPFELFCTQQENLNERHYLCRQIPMARRLHLDESIAANDADRRFINGKTKKRLLFIGIDFEGQILIEPEDGAPTTARSQSVESLPSIVEEKRLLRTLAARSNGELVVDVAETSNLRGIALIEYLQTKVTDGNYDILHFAGHSITIGSTTALIVPGETRTLGQQISMHMVRKWIKDGHCKLLVLSSCSAASPLAARIAMEGGAMGMLAFRWPVDDSQCTRFIKHFYEEFCKPSNKHGFAGAYRRACEGTHAEKPWLPTWASAVAVVRD